MESTITVGGQSVTLVALPASSAPKLIEFEAFDAVSVVQSIFTGQTQTQSWPGADMLSAKVTYPPLVGQAARELKAFLMELRGMSYALEMGDPDAQAPLGTPSGAPVVDGSAATDNVAGMTSLLTKGWTPNRFRLLLPGDAIQVGYRMHYVMAPVNSDAGGAATLSIWPSLREQPADGTALVLANPKGLFRLAKNQRSWSTQIPRVSSFSFDVVEYR